MWQDRANKQEEARQKLKSKTFADSDASSNSEGWNEENDNEATLSASQRKRLTGARLDTTLQSLVAHPAWSSGLGLSDHLTALKAKFVAADMDDDEMKATLEAVTGFDSRIVANPVKPPQFKKPCALLTGGICHCADHYAEVCRIVEQLHAFLQRVGCEASVPLCCFSAADPQLGSSASSSRPLRQSAEYWGLLGSVGKRPINHVFARYHHLACRRLKIFVANGGPQIESSHQLLQRMCSEFVCNGGRIQEFGCTASWQKQNVCFFITDRLTDLLRLTY